MFPQRRTSCRFDSDRADGGFILCHFCGSLSFMHRTAQRSAAEEFLYRTLGSPLYPLIYDRMWDVFDNNKAFQQNDRVGSVQHDVSFLFQQQLGRVNSFESSENYGAMKVYRNLYSDDGKSNDVSVAVKYANDNEEARQQLLNEAAILAACESLGDLRMSYLSGLTYDEDTLRAGIALQYIHGVNLDGFLDVVDAHGVMSRLQILHDLLRTVARLHQHGVFHNDLHAHNIIIGNLHLPFVVDPGGATIVPNANRAGCERSAKHNLSRCIKQLFSDVDKPSTAAPVCVQSIRKHLRFDEEGNDMKKEYALVDALGLLAKCPCPHHSYRDKLYVKPPRIVQREKISLRDHPAFAPHDLVCPICKPAPYATTQQEAVEKDERSD